MGKEKEQTTLDRVREQYAKQLTANGHNLTNNTIENDQAVFYCGDCGHSFAVAINDGKHELKGMSYEAECIKPVYKTPLDTDEKV